MRWRLLLVTLVLLPSAGTVRAQTPGYETCVQCLFEMAGLQSRMGDMKAVAATTRQIKAVATTPQARAGAEYVRASTLFHANRDKPKPEQLQAASVVPSGGEGRPKAGDGAVYGRADAGAAGAEGRGSQAV